jgi:hypothetical protein
MLLKPFYVFPLFFVLTSTIHAGCFGKWNYYCRKCDLHFTDAQRFYGDPNEHQPEVLQIPAWVQFTK